MSEEFNPKKIIDFSIDYYNILGLTINDLPNGSSRQDRINTSEIIEKAFRKKARTCHPDFGGSNEAFLNLVRARRILEDPLLKKIFDQGHFEEREIEEALSDFQVDWSKIGTYRKGTPEDTIGFSLFNTICENIGKDILVPAFFPTSNEHNYEWDFVIKSEEKNLQKLVISIVNDENEVLRLTSGEDLEKSLPFKIYICVPKASLSFLRKENAEYTPDGRTLVNGYITKAIYNDLNLLETTDLETAHNFIIESLTSDVQLINQGKTEKFQSKKGSQTKFMDSEVMKSYDKEKLSSIMNLRSFALFNNETAADFIDKIDKNDIKKSLDGNPDLPL
jgi:curved DNA-binding protein CbpA